MQTRIDKKIRKLTPAFDRFLIFCFLRQASASSWLYLTFHAIDSSAPTPSLVDRQDADQPSLQPHDDTIKMSDLNNLPFDLSESYMDMARSCQSQPGAKENPLVKALFGWMLPTSESETNNCVHDDTDSREPEDGNKQQLEESKRPQGQEPSDTAKAAKMEENLWKHPQEKTESNQDEASVETERTVESDWDDFDDDWDDTYSITSTDEESLAGEKAYDNWVTQTTFSKGEYNEDNEGDHYFNPTPKDLPRVWEPPKLPQGPQKADPPTEVKTGSHQVDFWAGVRDNLDKFKSFADNAIEQIFQKKDETQQKGDDARKKFAKRESFANTACRSLPTEAKRNEAKRASNKMMLQKSRSRDQVTQLSQQCTDNLPQHRRVLEKKNASSNKSLNTIGSAIHAPRGPPLRRSHTQDNLAQFFSTSVDSLSRSSARAQNTLHSQQPGLNGKFDKLMYASKEMSNSPANGRGSTSKKKSTRSKTARLDQRNPKAARPKASHRRTRSQRLIPSALGQNDFPWY